DAWRGAGRPAAVECARRITIGRDGPRPTVAPERLGACRLCRYESPGRIGRGTSLASRQLARRDRCRSTSGARLRMRFTAGWFALAHLVALSAPLAARGQAPASVEVAAGDRIHGDVQRLERGRLAFRTASRSAPGAQRWGGTIAIVWTEVVRLESEQLLEIELSSGERHTGAVSSPSPGRLVVRTPSGATSPIELRDIVSIIPLEAGFRARTTGTLDVGFSLA